MLEIGIINNQGKINKVLSMWIQHCAIIIDEISMDMFSNIIKQLAKARDFISETIAIFKTLSILIPIENFYQFSFMIGRLL